MRKRPAPKHCLTHELENCKNTSFCTLTAEPPGGWSCCYTVDALLDGVLQQHAEMIGLRVVH